MLVKNLTTLDLLFKRCECGHTTIYGFYQQVTWIECDAGHYFVRRCEKCGHEDELVYSPDGLAFANGGGI